MRPLHFSFGSSFVRMLAIQRQEEGAYWPESPRRRKARVARRGERGALARRRLIQRLAERVIVDVAVVGVGLDVAVIGIARQRQRLAQLLRAGEIDEVGLVLRVVGLGVDAVVVTPQELKILQAIAIEVRVGVGRGDRHIGDLAAPAGLAEELARIGGRILAPAIVLQLVRRAVPVQAAVGVAARLERHLTTRVRAVVELDAVARIAEAILRAQRKRAPEGVQAEERIGAWHERQGRDRLARNEIPAHHIAKGLVQSHAIHVHRQALRRAEQGMPCSRGS